MRRNASIRQPAHPNGRDTQDEQPARIVDQPARIVDQPARIVDQPAQIVDQPLMDYLTENEVGSLEVPQPPTSGDGNEQENGVQDSGTDDEMAKSVNVGILQSPQTQVAYDPDTIIVDVAPEGAPLADGSGILQEEEQMHIDVEGEQFAIETDS